MKNKSILDYESIEAYAATLSDEDRNNPLVQKTMEQCSGIQRGIMQNEKRREGIETEMTIYFKRIIVELKKNQECMNNTGTSLTQIIQKAQEVKVIIDKTTTSLYQASKETQRIKNNLQVEQLTNFIPNGEYKN